MNIVRVKDKYQVTIPADVREETGIEVGDILEAKTEKGKITLTRKSIIDQRLAEGLVDVRAGRVSPAFDNAEDAIRYLHKQVRRHSNAR